MSALWLTTTLPLAGLILTTLNSIVLPRYASKSRTGRTSIWEPGRKASAPSRLTIMPPLMRRTIVPSMTPPFSWASSMMSASGGGRSAFVLREHELAAAVFEPLEVDARPRRPISRSRSNSFFETTPSRLEADVDDDLLLADRRDAAHDDLALGDLGHRALVHLHERFVLVLGLVGVRAVLVLLEFGEGHHLALDLAGVPEGAAGVAQLVAVLDGNGRVAVDGLGAAGDALGDGLGGIGDGVGRAGGGLLRRVDGFVEEALGPLGGVFDRVLDGIFRRIHDAFDGVACLLDQRLIFVAFGVLGGCVFGRRRVRGVCLVERGGGVVARGVVDLFFALRLGVQLFSHVLGLWVMTAP